MGVREGVPRPTIAGFFARHNSLRYMAFGLQIRHHRFESGCRLHPWALVGGALSLA